MNTFKKHVPSFCDYGDERTAHAFATTEELLNLEDVERWRTAPNFSHFSLSGNRLMAILNNGYEWWVIGYIENPEQVNLPKWDGGMMRVKNPYGTIFSVMGSGVAWSCGDDVCMKDGRMLKRAREN